MAQRLQGAHVPFLLTDEDSPTDEEAFPTKRRCSIKSGKLRTGDTHVLHRIKLPHKMVQHSEQTPVYEEMCLAFFSNRYLGIVAEVGSPINEVILTHLREVFEDVDVYRWKVVREYHAAWLQLLEQGRAVWKDKGSNPGDRACLSFNRGTFSTMPPTHLIFMFAPIVLGWHRKPGK